MKTKLFLFLVVFGLFFITTQGQQTVLSSGGNATGSGGTSSYSIGQVAYANVTGSNGSASQGVQHPFEIVTLGTDHFSDIKLMMVYPNPNSGAVTLTTGNYPLETLECQIFDLSGRRISSQKITKSELVIQLEKEASAIYFLKVLDSNTLLKTFKIIKKN